MSWPVGHMFRPHTSDPFLHQLHARRVARNLSLTTLAELIGCNDSTLGGWERGDHSPTLASLQAWVNTLGLELTLCPLTKPLTNPRSPQPASPTPHSSPGPRSNMHGIAPR